MFSKTLTVSVAAYNVEDTLRRCLDSCTDDRVINDLDVIIVIDGSTDDSAAIASGYASSWPDTFRVVEKENGGYGSTVNTSMEIAKGRYFRLLDGDDWLDRDGLFDLVEFCRLNDVSAVYCDKIREYSDSSERERIPNLAPSKQIMKDVNTFGIFQPSMWNFTFNSSIMREHPFSLPHHRLYTDSLFMAYQLPYVATIAYLEKPLYHYSLGQTEEQSTSLKSVINHIDDNYANWDSMLSFCTNLYGLGKPEPLMMERLRGAYNNAYQRTLMLECSRENKARLLELDRDLKEKSPYIYEYMNKTKTIELMRVSKGLLYRLLVCYRKMHPYGC